MTQAQLKELYAAATVFTLPCHIADNGDRDGIPNVLVEAMAMELPVVTTNMSGIIELVDDRVNGLLVPQKDAVALADALAELLGNLALRRQLGHAARQKVCRCFDSSQTTVTLRSLFTACLERYQNNVHGVMRFKLRSSPREIANPAKAFRPAKVEV